MKRFLLYCMICALPLLAACDNNYIESDNVEELVVEGWIESGHAPVVLVSTTLPVSSVPQPLSNVSDHILRYAEVYIEHNGEREYLTARLTDRFAIKNYFTSTTLRGEPGQTYRLHVKWLDYEASAVCTIPEPVPIEMMFFEKAVDDTSFVARMVYSNDPAAGRYYLSFRRAGDRSKPFNVVGMSALDGSRLDTLVKASYMKSIGDISKGDLYFHPGDTLAIKLATMEKSMYVFWSSFNNYSNSAGTVLTSPTNVKGNVDGAIGYWAGYGIDIRELVCGED